MTKDSPPFINSLICDFKNVQPQAKEDKKTTKHKTYKAWMANASSGFCGEAGEAFLQGPAALDVRGRGQTPDPSPQELVKGVGEKGSSRLLKGASVADAARASPSGRAVDLGPWWFWGGVTSGAHRPSSLACETLESMGAQASGLLCTLPETLGDIKRADASPSCAHFPSSAGYSAFCQMRA